MFDTNKSERPGIEECVTDDIIEEASDDATRDIDTWKFSSSISQSVVTANL